MGLAKRRNREKQHQRDDGEHVTPLQREEAAQTGPHQRLTAVVALVAWHAGAARATSGPAPRIFTGAGPCAAGPRRPPAGRGGQTCLSDVGEQSGGVDDGDHQQVVDDAARPDHAAQRAQVDAVAQPHRDRLGGQPAIRGAGQQAPALGPVEDRAEADQPGAVDVVAAAAAGSRPWRG